MEVLISENNYFPVSFLFKYNYQEYFEDIVIVHH